MKNATRRLPQKYKRSRQSHKDPRPEKHRTKSEFVEAMRLLRADAPPGWWQPDIDRPWYPGDPPIWTGKIYTSTDVVCLYEDTGQNVKIVQAICSLMEGMHELLRLAKKGAEIEDAQNAARASSRV
jgi:hypothetical protein